MKKPVYDWFLELLNSSSEEAIGVIQSDPFAEEHKNVLCSDGRRRDVWKVDFGVIEKAAEGLKLHLFHILTSQDGNDPVMITHEKVSKTSRKC